MPSNNLTGMSNATALHYQKMKRDIQKYNESIHEYKNYPTHQANSTVYKGSSPLSYVGHVIRHWLR